MRVKVFGAFACSLLLSARAHCEERESTSPELDAARAAERQLRSPTIRFQSKDPDMQVYVRRESNERYGWVCSAPCTRTMLSGSYEIAVSRSRDDEPVPVESAVKLDRDASVTVDYASREATRVAGMALAVGGFFGGLGLLLFAGHHDACVVEDSTGGTSACERRGLSAAQGAGIALWFSVR